MQYLALHWSLVVSSSLIITLGFSANAQLFPFKQVVISNLLLPNICISFNHLFILPLNSSPPTSISEASTLISTERTEID